MFNKRGVHFDRYLHSKIMYGSNGHTIASASIQQMTSFYCKHLELIVLHNLIKRYINKLHHHVVNLQKH